MPSPCESSSQRSLPIERTAGGVPEVTVRAVAEGLPPTAQIVDVRQPSEFADELGHIEGARLVPLATLDAAAVDWDPARPLVVVCRSGGRSGRAASMLEQRGFTRVASLRGGMLAWNDAGLAVRRG